MAYVIALAAPVEGRTQTAAPSASFSASAQTIPVGDTAVTLRRLRWTNPYPAEPIDRLECQNRSPVATPILFGVTGLR